jgi:hypothetical protein
MKGVLPLGGGRCASCWGPVGRRRAGFSRLRLSIPPPCLSHSRSWPVAAYRRSTTLAWQWIEGRTVPC